MSSPISEKRDISPAALTTGTAPTGATRPQGASTLRQRLLHASVEIASTDLAEAEAAAALLPPGTAAYLPWLPNASPEELIESSRRLRALGLHPVPHIAARRLRSQEEARTLMQALAQEADVDSVLLIAGDLPQSAGPFDSALSLIESGLPRDAGLTRVGIAGYPEGHPRISADTLRGQLLAKLELLRAMDIEGSVVSQFCFDAPAIARWHRSLRADGVTVPIRIGLAGPARLRKLLAMGLRCGIGNSMRALKGKSGVAGALLSTQGPDELLRELASAQVLDDTTRLHFFAFGGALVTARWLAEARTLAQ
jgi:methylenetetrahydrofolate reductase (NADPH)